jgi:predicted dithiol-disulfide oxidoreductase (DUF899 family)
VLLYSWLIPYFIQIVSREEWVTARKELLEQEKAAVRANAEFNARLQNDFPMVKVNKGYTFESLDGKAKLSELFRGRKQLIIYHFMLGPDDDAGCSGCSFLADNLPSSVTHLNAADTTLVLVSRAPVDKIQEYKNRMGWNFPWYSSLGTDFNWDFNVSLDEAVAPTVYNVSGPKLASNYSYFTFSEIPFSHLVFPASYIPLSLNFATSLALY